VKDLTENGRNLPVTQENKLDYIHTLCYFKMAEEIKAQIESFLEGFHELIPPNLIGVFDSHELELLISGLPDIDSTFASPSSLYSSGPEGEHGVPQLHSAEPGHRVVLGSPGELRPEQQGRVSLIRYRDVQGPHRRL